ncbi:MAG: OmpH family outer membrane protein, partial [Bacteroidaceae bacterium]|nr:OmpH family outer membrane protein [Bacteroidaceae bacterium]
SAKNLTETQRTQRENAIVEKEKSAAELRRKYFGQEGELAKKQQELMQPIMDDIYEVVKAIAQDKGYSMVIDRASASSIIFASPNIDISDDVLAELGE